MLRPARHLVWLFVAWFACAAAVRAADTPDPVRAAVTDMEHGNFAAAEQKLRAELRLHPNDPRVLSLLGVALDGQKKFQEAEEFHRRALAAAPNSADVLAYQGNHLLAAGDEKGAREAYLKAVAADPAHANANMNLARLALKNHAPAEALKYLKNLPASQQELPRTGVLKAQALYLTGAGAEADALVERLAGAVKSDPGLSYSLGMALGNTGRFEKSETFLSAALAVAPTDFNLLYHVGVAASRAGHNERAREVLETALREQPDNVDALYALAWAEEGLKQRETAIGLLARGAKLAPQNADIQKLLAVVTTEFQAWADAAAAWDRYVKLAPNDDEARRERGLAVVRTGQYEQGAADLEWYIQRHPDDPTGHFELGLAQLDVDMEQAMAQLDKAVALKPDFAEARSTRGGLYYQQGKPEVALPDLEFAAAHLPDDAVTNDRLGQAYVALDRPANAVKVLAKAVQLKPDDPTIELHYARALADNGQTAEAAAARQRFQELGSARKNMLPPGLVDYLGLTPEERQANYRKRVEEAVAKDPADAQAQLHLLLLELEDGHIDAAVDAGRRIAQLKPDVDALAGAGKALLESKQNALAKDLLERAVAASASPSADVKLDLAMAVLRVDGADAGLARLDQMPESSRSADYYLVRARMLSASGKPDEAGAALEQALRTEPKRADLYWEAAAFLTGNGKTPDAQRLLDQATRDLPDAREIPLAKAITLELSGQSGPVGGFLKEVQSRWPEWAPGWVARGIVLANHGQYDEALQALDTAVSLGAHSEEAYYYLADVSLHATPKRLEKAESASAEALKTGPPDVWLFTLSASVAMERGDYAAAVERLKGAIALRPSYAPAHKLLAQAYEKLGRRQEAMDEQQQLRGASPSSESDPKPPYLIELFQSEALRDW